MKRSKKQQMIAGVVLVVVVVERLAIVTFGIEALAHREIGASVVDHVGEGFTA